MSHTQPSSETPLSPMSQQPNLTHEETMIESAASPKSQQNEETMNESDDDTPALDTQVFSPNLTKEIEREPSDDTPALDTQRETQTSTDETPPKTNQEEGKTNDEIVIESPAAQTQVLQKETLEMNETPSSPISPKSIEAQVFTPIQKQQTVTEGTYEATQPLTEIISANNKKEDTHAVHHTPSSPLSSLIALVIEENKNALHLQTSEGEQSDETPSEQNQAEENLKDTTEPTTELVSTEPTTEPTTEHVEVSRLLAHFQIGAEVEILSTDDEIWYPGKVVDLKLCEGLEELKVEYRHSSQTNVDLKLRILSRLTKSSCNTN
ncbi:hypothetical protein Bca52824_081724 [Brassica carinata]|uniref:Agenet-like domain-containing protein n=1 Tax=Brassica carinata TaxID=52824 RepID=A0A8X7PJ67_BRACI|nr:hypothetical protein Bca52824_081724 [Brassica carinata]